MPNGEMLFRTLDRVIANPEEHRQNTWRCETGMCAAGHAAVEAGGVWVDQIYGASYAHRAYLIAVPEDQLDYTELIPIWDRTTGGSGEVRAIHVAERAQRVLGLTTMQRLRLFAGNNTVEKLKDLVAEFTSGEE
jgi:hypothetical protein